MEGHARLAAEKVFRRVLKTIKPNPSEIRDTIRNTNEVMGLLKKIADRSVTIEVTGSIAKGTNLRGSADIDIFMLFDREISKEVMVGRGMAYAKAVAARRKHTRFEIKYAEHPYVRVYFDDIGIKLDLTPAYKLSRINDMGTSVDRTPLHTQFINSHLTDRQRDDVRLLKYLLKAHGLYGAEVKTKGFSGYLCELLVYNFGSLWKTIEFFSTASPPLSIDAAGRKAGIDPSLEKKFGSGFVVVDPVDPNRNVAAAVSDSSLARFVILCKMFVLKPGINTFYQYGVDINKSYAMLSKLIKDTGAAPHLLKMAVSDKTEDIVWPQLNRVSQILEKEIEKAGFVVLVSCSWTKGGYGYILYLSQPRLLNSRVVKGPSAFAKDYPVRFMKQHGSAYGFIIEEGHINAIERNPHPAIEDVIRSFVSSKNSVRSKDLKLGRMRVLRRVPKGCSAEAYAAVIGRLRI